MESVDIGSRSITVGCKTIHGLGAWWPAISARGYGLSLDEVEEFLDLGQR